MRYLGGIDRRVNMPQLDSYAVEQKWQDKWFADDIFSAERVDGKPKFFLVFAYPGISGYLHVGHMRGFTYADVICRYERMKGKQVLFPAGFHASGLPAVGLSKRVAREDPNTIKYLQNNGTPDDVIKTFSEPMNVVNYFKDIYTEDYWKKFGFTIDYSRAMTTITPGYKNFIQWQFHQLKKQDLLTHKPHYAPFCPGCGPIAVDASQTDVSQGGNAQINEFTMLKFRDESGLIYPAATLRPETIFGVTNMFLHPDVEYVVAELKGEEYLLSPEAFQKLKFQKEEEITQKRTIKGRELIGGTLTVPVTGTKVPILPGTFVDPNVATGVVMSVPAHAPFDWAALLDIWRDAEKLEAEYGLSAQMLKDIQIISLIKTSKSDSDNPAKDICDEMKITTQAQAEELEEATGVIYKNEFHSGVLKDNCGKYSGLRVSEIKDTLRVDFLNEGIADVFFEFSEPVVCRCDTPVVIKRIPKQWFIRYSDRGLTNRAQDHAMTMKIIPKEYYNDMPNVLEWFSDRACIRQGSWLGTEFPFEENWIIEPISDSTLYPTYYTVSKYVNDGSLAPEDLTNEFFDYVFLSEGDASQFGDKQELVETVRKDFDYWYPLDINLGGKEHKTVHFPVFVMNHVAILPGTKWPRGIFVNWWVTMSKGEKIAKSKGGAEPIPEAIQKYGVDAMRLYYCHIGSPDLDIEWEQKTVTNYKKQIHRVWDLVTGVLETKEGTENPDMDNWLQQQFQTRVANVAKALMTYDLRHASNEIYYGMTSDMAWYSKRGGCNPEILNKCCREWIRLMAPFTPHVAEELWEMAGGDGYVSLVEFPEPKELEDKSALYKEEFLQSTLEDARQILNIVKDTPKGMYFYTSPEWKRNVSEKLIEMKKADMESKKLNVGPVIKELMADEQMRKFGKIIPKFVNQQAMTIAIMSEKELAKASFTFDETSYLADAKEFFEKELGCKVETYSADSDDKVDPNNKSSQAKPLRPAIYVET